MKYNDMKFIELYWCLRKERWMARYQMPNGAYFSKPYLPWREQ